MVPGSQPENVEVPGSLRRERPWLYPYNRRLRHLQGISLRNLSINVNPTRPRGASVDDEVLPYALKSPAKALAIREHKQLEHSRSQSNLRPIKETEGSIASKGKENAIEDGDVVEAKPKRPNVKSMRRRSTLEWVNASPLARQKKLEDIVSARMVNVFFSLHVTGLEDPIYVSETFEKVMNPDFRFFNLSELGPSISRLDGLTVKVWAKSSTMDDYKNHMEMNMSLRSLQFIGKTMDSYRKPLPQNCILFHMKDGIYTTIVELPASEPPMSSMTTPQRALSNQVLPTSSYDALMRLSTLDDCVQDALHTRANLEREMNALLEENREPLETVHSVAVSQQKVEDVEAAIQIEKKQLAAARRRRDEMKAQLEQNKEHIQKGREAMQKGTEEIAVLSESLRITEQELQHTGDEISGQRRRVCEDLLKIFPIEPIPNRSLAFTIRGLALPNSEFEDANEEVTSAALGHAAQVVHMLQFYLSIPLPYPIEPRGSTSLIEDPISDTTGSRTYPLFMKGTIKYRFEYGVFLLNKNMEILSNHIGLRFIDPRQTLPNLKYLLYIATAGKGEIPARKAGGIRGFLRGEGENSELSSRRGSADSQASSTTVVAEGKQAVGGAQPAKKLLAGPQGAHVNPWVKSNGAAKTGYGSLAAQQKSGFRKGSKLRDVS